MQHLGMLSGKMEGLIPKPKKQDQLCLQLPKRILNQLIRAMQLHQRIC